MRALDALSRMREGYSLTRAARDALTTPRTILKHVGQVLSKGRGGRYTARPSDRLTRSLRFLTGRGLEVLKVRGSRAASRIARYWTAVQRYVTTGQTAVLREFRGKTIRLQKITYRFITDPQLLDRLANAGEVAFEDLYARSA